SQCPPSPRTNAQGAAFALPRGCPRSPKARQSRRKTAIAKTSGCPLSSTSLPRRHHRCELPAAIAKTRKPPRRCDCPRALLPLQSMPIAAVIITIAMICA
ncbi:hypothetical protein Dimus_008046, partial [Dionaea muscipula]